MKRKIAFLASILLVLTLSGTYIYVPHSSRFNLAQIDIQGNHKIGETEILEKAQIKLGSNIFRMDLGRIQRLIREDERIKDVRVRRELPNRILIEVEEKKPALWINLPEGLYGLSQDQELIPLEKEDFEHDLPVVTGLASLPVSGKQNQNRRLYEWWANRNVKSALDLYKTLLEVDSSFLEIISEINLSDENNLVFYLIPYGTQVSMGKGSFKKKLKRVKAILDYEGKREDLASIDLRFKDQVVVKKSLPGFSPSSSANPQSQLSPTRQKGLGGKENL
jgi:cell division protein FtsQ